MSGCRFAAAVLSLLWCVLAGPAAAGTDGPKPDSFLATVRHPFNTARTVVIDWWSGMNDRLTGYRSDTPRLSVPWGYDGMGAPDRWSQLSPQFALCGQGRQQSPVDLRDPTRVDAALPRLSWQDVPVTMVNTGRSVAVEVPPGPSLILDGTTFALRQIQFRHPSEHMINGEAFPLEAQFIHLTEDAAAAVVLAVFFDPGDPNPVLDRLWQVMPTIPGRGDGRGTFAPADLLPQDPRLYAYQGSLTTPPCSENVRWLIFHKAVTASQEQILALARLYPNNARPAQPLGDRVVRTNF